MLAKDDDYGNGVLAAILEDLENDLGASNVTQADCKSRLATHIRTEVVLPKPVGAVTRLTFFVSPTSSRASSSPR